MESGPAGTSQLRDSKHRRKGREGVGIGGGGGGGGGGAKHSITCLVPSQGISASQMHLSIRETSKAVVKCTAKDSSSRNTADYTTISLKIRKGIFTRIHTCTLHRLKILRPIKKRQIVNNYAKHFSLSECHRELSHTYNCTRSAVTLWANDCCLSPFLRTVQNTNLPRFVTGTLHRPIRNGTNWQHYAMRVAAPICCLNTIPFTLRNKSLSPDSIGNQTVTLVYPVFHKDIFYIAIKRTHFALQMTSLNGKADVRM